MKIYLAIFSLFFLLTTAASAHEIGTGAAELLPRVNTSAYALPYPGLLSDNPLYGLKMFRDRVVSFLITDHIKKAEFNLLQADKRLATGVYLLRKDKTQVSLATSTILKGENYFEEAIAHITLAKKQGLVVNDMLRKLFVASHKHQEVLRDLQKTAGKENGLKVALNRVVQFENDLRVLLEQH